MPSSTPGGAGDLATRILLTVILLVPVVAAVILARWNFVRGKGDRCGAMRLAILMFGLHLVLWVFDAHFSSVRQFCLPPGAGH